MSKLNVVLRGEKERPVEAWLDLIPDGRLFLMIGDSHVLCVTIDGVRLLKSAQEGLTNAGIAQDEDGRIALRD